MADEGAGASLTFGTAGITLDLVSIQSQGVDREALPNFHHGTTGGYKTYQPGDFTDPGALEISWLYDPNDLTTGSGAMLPIKTVAETVTLTYPVPAGDATGATEASSAFITNFSPPELSIDQMMIATATLKRSGVVTFTTSST